LASAPGIGRRLRAEAPEHVAGIAEAALHADEIGVLGSWWSGSRHRARQTLSATWATCVVDHQ
jgi:hypothetical protein